MTKNEIRVCWDSCVIIDFFQKNPDRITAISAVLDEARSGRVKIVVSAMAIAELVRCNDGEHHLIDKFFRESFVSVRDVDRFIARTAAQIGRSHGISPPDAIHVATALLTGCAELQTYDGCGAKPRKHHLLPKDGTIERLAIKTPNPFSHRKGDCLPGSDW